MRRVLPIVVAMLSSPVMAQVDTVVSVVGAGNTVGGVGTPSPLATYSYDPVSDRMFVAGFNGIGQDIRVVNNVSGIQTFTRLVTNTPWLQFTKDGDLNRGGGAPTPGSLMLNPTSVGSFAPYSLAIIADGAGGVTIGSPAVSLPEISRRIYSYNLQPVTDGDARGEMQPLVNTADLQLISGSSSSTTNTGRQTTFSSDSAKVYFIDSSAGHGGLYTVPTLGGSVTRLVVDSDINTEPTVIRVAGNDRIHFRGSPLSPAGDNTGGIDYFDTADNTRKVLLTGQQIADFLEIPLTTTTTTTDVNIDIFSTGSDADGNLYFNTTDSSPNDARGIYKVDPQGRMIKVVSYAERRAVFGPLATSGNPNSNTLRMQSRDAMFGGPNGNFGLRQLMYVESSGVNAVAGAWVFKPGDFDRDNDADLADIALFKAKLKPRGVAISSVDDSRYDLNGNNVTDWKDVKILQSFLGFSDGDANIDFSVDFSDLLVVAQNFGITAGMVWTQGDFTGDDAVTFSDLLILAQNYGGGTIVAGDQLSIEFVSEWNRALTMVPEPTSLAAVAMGIVLFSRRSRR
jgi:hypothetical protein